VRHNHKHLSMPDRYWAKVDIRGEDECWPWIPPAGRDGYGRITINYRTRKAHVVGLEIRLGRPLRPGYKSLHTCDYKPCQNPRHLYEGTPLQNMQDKIERNRARLRTSHHNSKLTEEQYEYVLSSPATTAQVARELGVSWTSIDGFRSRNGYVRATVHPVGTL
jgi:hypothetical protein